MCVLKAYALLRPVKRQNNNMRQRRADPSILIVCGLLLLLWLNVGAAQLDADPPALQAAGPIEEVIVTARRREESVQDVPISMTALTGPDLRLQQIYRADQLTTIVPNLEFDATAPSSGSSSVGQLFIRGVGQTDFTPVTDPGVAIYLDGIYLARAPGNVLDLINVERIEVLRGPQGTLFGRNAIGGAISIHTRRPDAGWSGGTVQARVGTDALRELNLTWNQPLSADYAMNAMVYRELQDGYVTRVSDGIRTGDRDRWGLRAALDGQLTTDISLFMVVDMTRIDENGAPVVNGGLNDRQPFGNFGNGLLGSCAAVNINPGFDATPGSGPPSFPPPGASVMGAPGCYDPGVVPGPFVSEGTYPVASKLDNGGIALTLNWDINSTFSLLSTTGWRTMDMFSSRDGDNTPANIFATRDDYEHEQLSQEFQLHFDTGHQLKGLLGLYLFDEDGFDKVDVTVPGGALRSGGFYHNQSGALFAHAAHDIGRQLTLSLGIRYTRDRKTFTPDQYVQGDASMGGVPDFFPPTWPLLAGQYLGPTGPLPAGTRILAFEDNVADFDHTDFNIDVSWHFDNGNMAYVTYSTGYKSGGFDQRFVGPTANGKPSTFEPETLVSLEFGLKGISLTGRLRWNMAIFDASYDDLQIIVRESFNPLTVNAGKAHIRGAELEADWWLDASWTLRFAGAWLQTSYDYLSDAAQASGVRLDNDLVNSPEWSTSIGIIYEHQLTSGGVLSPRLDWSWQDSQFNDAINSPQIRQDAYQLLNLSLAWDLPGDNWQILGGVRNVLDETILTTGNSAFDTSAAYVEQVYARPREWQLSVRYAF